MRILTVAAHPDDETLGAGGTIARLSAAGHEVSVCIMADGATARHPHKELQQRCAERAADVLGVHRIQFCDFPDQRLDTMSLMDVAVPIEKCVVDFDPEIVLTHFAQDVNQDHRITFAATMIAARPVPATSVRSVLCFEVPSSTEWAAPFPGSVFAPNVFADISNTLDTKLAAMHEYSKTFTGEVLPFPHPRSYQALDAIARCRGSAVGIDAAEAFMLVRAVIRDGESVVPW